MWEIEECACRGPAEKRQQDLLYAAACTAGSPQPVDRLRVMVERKFDRDIPMASAVTALAADRRFCWAGPGRYGLFRHGPLPGPRTLEQVTRLTLHACSGPLRLTQIHHWLAALGYVYRRGSLLRAVRASQWIVSGTGEELALSSGDLGLLRLRTDIAPETADSDWLLLRDGVAGRFADFRTEETMRYSPLSVPPWMSHGPDWRIRRP
ncbi:hypothetical protein OG875_11350 [Streptomyces sp. NBC_01498]|uniref:hypothetical protein n=1 Tax=Streptomyces sp. NBC_01498 TaxID=2975870 RepID=UPI002E7B96E6|nr:hypothetical protein [Streptomyces sp. NBC_01498]WTL25138.1 hypothetical protein OG875_11350 [Streptomyces sp. NBC_01498]